jgi:hypothetical protein
MTAESRNPDPVQPSSEPKASTPAKQETKERKLVVEKLEERVAPRLSANHNETFLTD